MTATIQVRYQSWATLVQDCQQQLALQGLYLKGSYSLAPYDPVTIQLEAPDGTGSPLAAEVLQIFPNQGLAVRFKAECVETLRQLTIGWARLAQSAAATPGGAPTEDPQISWAAHENAPPSPPAPTQRDPSSEPGAPPKGPAQPAEAATRGKQLESMSVNERQQAALHGRKDLRMLLIRDRNKTLHPFVLKNPAITLEEIEQIAKMPSVNPEVLRMIASNREWNRQATVCRNLVRNPQTPTKEAIDLLKHLPESELRSLAKSGNVRTAIQQAARKKLAL